MDDNEPGAISCLECCWDCACGMLDLVEEGIDFIAFSHRQVSCSMNCE